MGDLMRFIEIKVNNVNVKKFLNEIVDFVQLFKYLMIF